MARQNPWGVLTLRATGGMGSEILVVKRGRRNELVALTRWARGTGRRGEPRIFFDMRSDEIFSGKCFLLAPPPGFKKGTGVVHPQEGNRSKSKKNVRVRRKLGSLSQWKVVLWVRQGRLATVQKEKLAEESQDGL